MIVFHTVHRLHYKNNISLLNFSIVNTWELKFFLQVKQYRGNEAICNEPKNILAAINKWNYSPRRIRVSFYAFH